MLADDAADWLSSVLPSSRADSGVGKQLELHRRLVHLATLREEALSQLQQLDGVKVALTERKVIQQGRLIAALDARLVAAHAAVDPHRVAVHDHIRALEKAAAFYSNILQGAASQPGEAEWDIATQQYHQLQKQQKQYQQQLLPAQLAGSLAASLQPCPVSQVEAVEHLRAEKDQLLLDLQGLRSSSQQASQQIHEERAARLLAEQQKHSMQEELHSLRQLAENVAQRLQISRQQQLPGLLCSQQQAGQVAPAAGSGPATASSNAQSFLAECQQLRQQLQQIYSAADGKAAAAAVQQPIKTANDQGGLRQQDQQFQADLLQQQGQDLLDPAAVLASDPLQELRHSILSGSRTAAGPPTSGLWCLGGSSESRLRQAYQQMLKQVQARYQQESRQTEMQHHQALQSQAKNHTEALTKLTQQYQEACTRLAAASADEAQAQQQASKLQQENQQLQQQVKQLQQELSSSASSALALAQVQHEQQLLAVKQEHEQLIQQAKQELDSLRQQLKEQAAAVPSAASVAAMVQEATEAHFKGQQATYQCALQQREQQHLSLLEELAQLRQLHAEPSGTSVGSEASAQQHQLPADSPADVASSSEQQAQQQAPRDGPSAGLLHPQPGPDKHTLRAWWEPLEAKQDPKHTAPEADGGQDSNGSADQHWQQQQQEPSPMSSLIAAVLGSGPKARAMQAAHAQRMQQQATVQQHDHDQLHSTAALLHAMDYQGQLAELDQVLGLNQGADAADSSARVSSRQTCSPDRARPTPPAAADNGYNRVAVAQHIQQQAAVEAQLHAPAVRSRTNSRSPPMMRGQHRQQEVRSIGGPGNNQGTCLRCSGNDASSPGRCCFHPGLVPVPGPLMYSPEWHACRASCTPDMPGCYSRREHYYLPQFSATTGCPTAAGCLNNSSCSDGPARRTGMSPLRGSSSASSRAAQGPVKRATTSSANRALGSSCAWSHAKSSGRVPLSQQQGALRESTPRSTIPRPVGVRSGFK